LTQYVKFVPEQPKARSAGLKMSARVSGARIGRSRCRRLAPFRPRGAKCARPRRSTDCGANPTRHLFWTKPPRRSKCGEGEPEGGLLLISSASREVG
jgi:hypothetical protein